MTLYKWGVYKKDNSNHRRFRFNQLFEEAKFKYKPTNIQVLMPGKNHYSRFNCLFYCPLQPQ
jgi:hypothetical protein